MIRIHLNLHKSKPGNFVYSVRRGSNPVAHQSTVTIEFDSWHVGVNGLANVRKRGVRQVFAWAKGKELAHYQSSDGWLWWQRKDGRICDAPTDEKTDLSFESMAQMEECLEKPERINVPPPEAQLISFNPFKEGKFVWASDRTPCDNLGKVYFTPTGAYAIR